MSQGLPSDEPRAALPARLGEFADAVDCHLGTVIDGAPLPADLAGMLRYHLGWVDERFQPTSAPRGKQLRPALCLLACEAAGGNWREALSSAAAVELIHNFSLAHDDIEDGSPLRRHRPTLWALWGVPRAINAGDTLLILAQLAALGEDGSDARRLAAARLLNRACRELCTGQHRDLSEAEGPQPTLDEYLATIEGKTAALLQAAAELGALAAGAPGWLQAAYGRFGRELGLAFQLQDDVLDAWGDTVAIGKPAREDVRSRKQSLPIILGLGTADGDTRARLRALYERPAPLSDEAVEAVIALLEALGVRAEAERLVQAHFRAAAIALAEANPDPAAGRLLEGLAESLVGRQA